MKNLLFITSLIWITSANAKTTVLQCETSYGHDLRLTIENQTIKYAEASLSGFSLLSAQVDTQCEVQNQDQTLNTWKFLVPSAERVLLLRLPKTLPQHSEILGSFLIEAPTVSAEFPLSCLAK
jgi:hypothetical protein